MNPNAPRLSLTMTGTRHPHMCANCGRATGKLEIWQEHDHNDQREQIFFPLCKACSDKIIEPHPRLYRQLSPNEPCPGCMPICMDCPHRKGTSCGHPNARINGGKGVLLIFPEPTRGFIDGSKYRGPIEFYHGPVTACDCKDSSKTMEIRRQILVDMITSHPEYRLMGDLATLFFPDKAPLRDQYALFAQTHNFEFKIVDGRDVTFTKKI